MSQNQLEIIPVNNNKLWSSFVKLPYRFYKNNVNWVPPLISEQKTLLNPLKHPFYEHAKSEFFLAMRNNRLVGRIAALIDEKHNVIHREKMGFFGFFLSENNTETSSGLLSAAADWVKTRGMKKFRGPVNPCQNEDCGLLIDNFESPPVIMMPYNPPYFAELFEHFGLKKVMDLYAYYIEGKRKPPEKLIRVAEVVRKRENLIVRPVNMKIFDDEAKKVWYVYNNAWHQNWGFVPMTEAEFQHLAKTLKSVIVPELALMAEINGDPVGFSLSLPDINQALIHTNGHLFPTGIIRLLWHSRKIDMIRIIIMGVIHKYQRKGIDSIFYLDTWRNAGAKGYYRGEMSWILENNTMMNRAAKMLGGQIYKTYRMYQMKL